MLNWSTLFLSLIFPRIIFSFILQQPFTSTGKMLSMKTNNEINTDGIMSSVGTSSTFNSLEALGLKINITSESIDRKLVPLRLVGGTDLFCTRELNMAQMEAIGFDMDFTLAQYTLEFDLLAYNGAKEKLVKLFGYPKEVLDFEYSPTLIRRGCLIDKKRGNVIKLDRFKYVRVAQHGLTKLSSDERKSTYIQSFIEMQSYTGSNFVSVDTPFSLVDGCLFCQLVDLKDRLGLSKSYESLWTEMRRAVDRCHKDGVIKKTVAMNPSKYIIHDPALFPMLNKFKSAGFKVFLLTNSLFDYTQVVMNYLEGKKSGDSKDNEWMKVFDVIVVGGNKPAFLTDDGKLPLLRVQETSGKLDNVDATPTDEEVSAFLAQGKCFQGGNAQILHDLLQISSGDRLLYVGDHIYADVMRSKRVLGWRTCLIVPELTEEIILHKKNRHQRNELMALRRQQFEIETKLESLQLNSDAQAAIEQSDSELETLKRLIREKLEMHNMAFHPTWGQLFKAGFQESRFAQQIEDYACVYTSKASNLGRASPRRPFRPVRDKMPHDHFLEGL